MYYITLSKTKAFLLDSTQILLRHGFQILFNIFKIGKGAFDSLQPYQKHWKNYCETILYSRGNNHCSNAAYDSLCPTERFQSVSFWEALSTMSWLKSAQIGGSEARFSLNTAISSVCCLPFWTSRCNCAHRPMLQTLTNVDSPSIIGQCGFTQSTGTSKKTEECWLH